MPAAMAANGGPVDSRDSHGGMARMGVFEIPPTPERSGRSLAREVGEPVDAVGLIGLRGLGGRRLAGSLPLLAE